MFLWVAGAVHVALLGLLVGSRTSDAVLLGGYAVFHVVLAWGVLHPRSRLFGPNVSRLPSSERVVALTFDDGPHPDVTPRVLEILRGHGVHATFFVIGKWAERHPELVRRIAEDGHVVGNHSYAHSYRFWALLPSALERELGRTERAIEAASGARSRWFRAPVGMKSPWLSVVLRRRGLRLASWNVRFLDRGPADPARIRKRLRRRLVPGSILLLHDGHDRKPAGNPAVVACLPVILASLHELGYRCVPLPADGQPACVVRPCSSM